MKKEPIKNNFSANFSATARLYISPFDRFWRARRKSIKTVDTYSFNVTNNIKKIAAMPRIWSLAKQVYVIRSKSVMQSAREIAKAKNFNAWNRKKTKTAQSAWWSRSLCSLMKTATSSPNEAKSPRFLISENSERLHFFISEASSSARRATS